MQGSIVLPLRAAAVATVATDDAPPSGAGPFGRTLRIALAMKGGVSLAVWIGGAVTELDVLRRIRLTGTREAPEARLLTTSDPGRAIEEQRDVVARAAVYAQLLASRRYDAVELDVLAGASAGGLNAVMYGVAQRVGTTTDRILELWRRSGDVWELMRPAGASSVDSVLRGDDYFWRAMRDALEALHDAPSHAGLVARVSVDLSATVIDAEASSERGTREGKAHFHFAGGFGDDPRGRVIPAAGAADRDAVLARLAYAARSTSSFPGAFEPALIYSGTVPAHPEAVDMRDAFHAHREPRARTAEDALPGAGDVLDPFRVIDGGVTDNVPIDRALRAIRSRSAEHYVDRALVYLDPSPKLELAGLARPTAYHGRPPRPDGSVPRTDPRSAFLGVVLTGIGHMLGRESKDDEVDDVERFRRLLHLERAKDELFAPLTEAEIALADGEPLQVKRAYARFRSAADLELLTDVLTQPSLWLLPTRQPRAEHRAFRREELLALDGELFSRFSRLEGAALEGVCTGPQAQVDACRCLISWVRALEDGAFWGPDDPADPHSIAWLDELWGDATGGRGRSALRTAMHALHQESLDDRDAAVSHLLEHADATAPAVAADPSALAIRLTDAWLELANQQPQDTERWARLNDLVDELRAVSAAVRAAEQSAPPYSTAWSRSPWSGIGQSPPAFRARDLAPLVAARGMPLGMPAMTYEDITAGDAWDVDAYASLVHAQMLAGYRSLLRLRPDDARELALDEDRREVSDVVRHLMPDDRLQPRTKLAGMSLANFAGFLSADWRTNDWWWGRLDAARGAVGFLESLRPAPTASATLEGEDPAAAVEAAVLDEWRASLAQDVPSRAAFQERLGVEAGGLSALHPDYRVAVASRLLRLLSRALVRGSRWTAPHRAALWLLRPLLVLAPMLLDPARAAVVGALLAAPVLLLVPREAAASGPWATAGVIALALAIIAPLVSLEERVLQSRAVWAALDARRRGHVERAVRRARWEGVAWGSAALAMAVVAALLTGPAAATPVSAWMLLAAAVVLALVARARFLVPRLSSGHGPWRTARWAALAVLLVGGSWLFRGGLAIRSDPADPAAAARIALVVGAAGAALAVALTIGWLGGAARQSHAQPGERPRLEGAVALLATAVLCGIAAGGPFALLLLVPWASVGGCLLAAMWLWGTVLWWVPAVWQPSYRPSDRPARRDAWTAAPAT